MSTNTETIQQIAVSVARIEERQIRYEENQVELIKAIKGNGKPGLLDRVSVLESSDKERTKRECAEDEVIKDGKQKRWDVKTKVILAFVGGGISFGFGYLLSLIK